MAADTKYETIRGEVVSGSFSSSGPDPFGGSIGDADAMRRFAEQADVLTGKNSHITMHSDSLTEGPSIPVNNRQLPGKWVENVRQRGQVMYEEMLAEY